MQESKDRHPLLVFLALAVTLPLAYYGVVLFHEWAHGTTAWLFGYKTSPFEIRYGGWLLLGCDELVPYARIIAHGRGVEAALIGISGYTMNWVLFILSVLLLATRPVMRSLWPLAILYWSCVLNLMAVFGYVPLDAFSSGGDIGWFVNGLGISPWPGYVLGTVCVALGIAWLFRSEIVKVYVFAPIRTLYMKRVLLGVSLFFLFLFLYVRGYDPFTADESTFVQVQAGLSILLVPVLFVVCDPTRGWVERAAERVAKGRP